MGLNEEGVTAEEMKDILEYHRVELEKILTTFKGKRKKKKILKRIMKFLPLSFILNYVVKRISSSILIPWLEIKMEEYEEIHKMKRIKKRGK